MLNGFWKCDSIWNIVAGHLNMVHSKTRYI